MREFLAGGRIPDTVQMGKFTYRRVSGGWSITPKGQESPIATLTTNDDDFFAKVACMLTIPEWMISTMVALPFH